MRGTNGRGGEMSASVVTTVMTIICLMFLAAVIIVVALLLIEQVRERHRIEDQMEKDMQRVIWKCHRLIKKTRRKGK